MFIAVFAFDHIQAKLNAYFFSRLNIVFYLFSFIDEPQNSMSSAYSNIQCNLKLCNSFTFYWFDLHSNIIEIIGSNILPEKNLRISHTCLSYNVLLIITRCLCMLMRLWDYFYPIPRFISLHLSLFSIEFTPFLYMNFLQGIWFFPLFCLQIKVTLSIHSRTNSRTDEH